MDINNKERKEFHTKEYVAPIDDFEHRFPCMFKHVISFDEIDYDKVYMELDDGRTLYYDRFYNFYWNVKRFNSIYELSEEEWRKGFSDRLRKRLRTKNIKQYDLAKKLGVSEMTVSGYITGKRTPNAYYLELLATILNCDINDLLPKDHIII